MPLRSCPECNESIRGRVDKKFCSDYCRNAYHNRMNKDSRNLIRRTNNRLRKNYRILESFPLKKGTATTSRNHLSEKGFDFECITSVYTTKKGNTYWFVYDMGYLALDKDIFVIVKRG